jgi:hypothetical protein
MRRAALCLVCVLLVLTPALVASARSATQPAQTDKKEAEGWPTQISKIYRARDAALARAQQLKGTLKDDPLKQAKELYSEAARHHNGWLLPLTVAIRLKQDKQIKSAEFKKIAADAAAAEKAFLSYSPPTEPKAAGTILVAVAAEFTKGAVEAYKAKRKLEGDARESAAKELHALLNWPAWDDIK